MPIENQTYARLRFTPLGALAARAVRSVEESVGDLAGSAQLSLGLEPTVIRTPRLALEQWKYALREVPEPGKGRIIIAAIRNRRWVEWAVFSACYIVRMGYEPVLLYSGEEIAGLYGKERTGMWRGPGFWMRVKGIPFLQLVDLDEFTEQVGDNTAYDDFIQSAAHTIAAYDLRVEEFEPDQAPGEYDQSIRQAEQMLRTSVVALERALEAYPARRFICPSGLIGRSLAFYEVARQKGIPSVYVEGWALRPGHLIWNIDRPALEYDIAGWLRILGEWDERRDADSRDYMAFREGERIDREGWLDDFHQVQRSSKEARLPGSLVQFLQRPGPFFLLGTNVVGDSSTLRRSTIFRSQQDWIQRIVAFFRQHPRLNLIVRAHPDEVWVDARVRLGDMARNHAGDVENIYVVVGDENVNTYALVEHVDVGLAWVSTIGLDMAVLGKPVILAAAAKYAGLGACYEPQTQEAYFDLILELAANPVGPDKEAITRGKAYHHIVFKMMSLQADSKNYSSIGYRLGDPNEHPDRRTFYRILVGELSAYGQTLPDRTAAAD